MLNFIEYISWVYADQEPESYFQFVRKQKSKDIEKYSDSIYGFEFEEFYYSQLFTVHPFSYSTNFLDYHFGKYTGNKFDFLNFVKWSFFILGKLKFELLEKYNETSQNTINKDVVFEWIKEKKKELETTEPDPKRGEKIKWLCSPASLAFIMQELVDHGYIEPPQYGPKGSMSRLAKLCYRYFDIDCKPEYFERAMRNPVAMINYKQNKFRIPDCSDIA